MEGVTEISHELRVFEYICNVNKGHLRRVDVVHGRICVHEGREGDFRSWQASENGGFRRFPIDLSRWTNRDVLRFKMILGSRSTFFVLLHEDNAQIYPSRLSLS